jgi:glycerophosphoryl diester phosphodiesterase
VVDLDRGDRGVAGRLPRVLGGEGLGAVREEALVAAECLVEEVADLLVVLPVERLHVLVDGVANLLLIGPPAAAEGDQSGRARDKGEQAKETGGQVAEANSRGTTSRLPCTPMASAPEQPVEEGAPLEVPAAEREKLEKEGAASKPAPHAPPTYRRVGHKGADAIVPGNSIASFEAAIEAGVDMIEFDVLRTREGQLIVAHDYQDAGGREVLTLTEALDAFRYAPLDKVDIDCDLKLVGREAELAGALAGHGLTERATVSTMEVESLIKLRQLEPELSLGWTIPKTRHDWSQHSLARPALGAGLAILRRRLPKMIREDAPSLDIDAIMAYHPIVSPEAVTAAEEQGLELYAWTVDDPERVAELAEMGVHAIISNDPRIL